MPKYKIGCSCASQGPRPRPWSTKHGHGRARRASVGVCGSPAACPCVCGGRARRVRRAPQAHATAVGRARRVPRTRCLCERGDPSKGRACLACKWQMSLVAMIHRDSSRPYPHTTHLFLPIAMEVISYVEGRKTQVLVRGWPWTRKQVEANHL